MPSIKTISATSADTFSNLKFADIPSSGAIINMWAAGDDAGDTVALSVGDRDLLVASECNIEQAPDEIDLQKDQLLFNEVVGGGHIFVPVVATAEIQILVSIRYL